MITGSRDHSWQEHLATTPGRANIPKISNPLLPSTSSALPIPEADVVAAETRGWHGTVGKGQ